MSRAEAKSENSSNYYITTAIPYANAAPHIGTAMDYLYADILASYQKNQGKNVKFSVGTDEHGTKVERKAAENSKTPQQQVDDLQPDFQAMRRAVIDEFDQRVQSGEIVNVRTSDAWHVARAQAIWTELAAKQVNAAGEVRAKTDDGDATFQDLIYKSTYEGWYCAGCEAFLTETEAKEVNYICPDHNKPLEKLSEDNYYLRVSAFTEQIREFAATRVVPAYRGKEILELVKNGAQDVSISRPKEKLSWGIEVPGDDSQVMYVWIDALSNYLTVLAEPDATIDEWKAALKTWWPAQTEIVGKDILRFHAIIWPAILLGLGLALPERIMVHGFINVAGAKMSKSVGNVISPLEIIENYGADAFRYYFTRHVPTFDDGDFTWEKFENAYNGELANDLGNLVSRVAQMMKKYEISRDKLPSLSFADLIGESVPDYTQAFSNLDFTRALDIAWDFVQSRNQFIEENQPWALAKTDRAKLESVMNILARDLLTAAELLNPFLPDTSAKIRKIFAGEILPNEIPILFPKKYLHTEEPARK